MISRSSKTIDIIIIIIIIDPALPENRAINPPRPSCYVSSCNLYLSPSFKSQLCLLFVDRSPPRFSWSSPPTLVLGAHVSEILAYLSGDILKPDIVLTFQHPTLSLCLDVAKA